MERRVADNAVGRRDLYTDDAQVLWRPLVAYDHATVDHAERYVDGRVHTNGIENFWALLKRGLHGTYVSVEPFHLFRYLDERVFAYNLRELDDYGRFEAVLSTISGRRLTAAELTGARLVLSLLVQFRFRTGRFAVVLKLLELLGLFRRIRRRCSLRCGFLRMPIS